MTRFLTAPLAVALVGFLGIAGSAPASAQHGHARQHAGPDITTFASGLNNPRGLTFGPDGNLYVAEGGLGGTDSTVGKCQQAAGAAAPTPEAPTAGGSAGASRRSAHPAWSRRW